MADENTTPDTPAGDPSAEGTESNDAAFELESKLTAAEAARDEFQDRALRATAELENYRKRAQKEIEQERQYRAMDVVRSILPVMDNLQRAVQAAKNSRDVDQLLQGLQMVIQQFDDTLGRNSIVPIPAVGQPFDANLHEAISQAPSAEHPPMTVIMEVERGYQLHDRVVRPTKVIVSQAPAQ